MNLHCVCANGTCLCIRCRCSGIETRAASPALSKASSLNPWSWSLWHQYKVGENVHLFYASFSGIGFIRPNVGCTSVQTDKCSYHADCPEVLGLCSLFYHYKTQTHLQKSVNREEHPILSGHCLCLGKHSHSLYSISSQNSCWPCFISINEFP